MDNSRRLLLRVSLELQRETSCDSNCHRLCRITFERAPVQRGDKIVASPSIVCSRPQASCENAPIEVPISRSQPPREFVGSLNLNFFFPSKGPLFFDAIGTTPSERSFQVRLSMRASASHTLIFCSNLGSIDPSVRRTQACPMSS